MGSVIQQLPSVKAVVVVTPQELAHLDARKLVTLLRGFGTEILGGIDNMVGFLCPCCGQTTALFPPVAADRSILSTGVDHLGEIPLDPAPAHIDTGIPVVLSRPDSSQAKALCDVVDAVRVE